MSTFNDSQVRALVEAVGLMTPEYTRNENPYGEEQAWEDYDANVEAFARSLRRFDPTFDVAAFVSAVREYAG